MCKITKRLVVLLFIIMLLFLPFAFKMESFIQKCKTIEELLINNEIKRQSVITEVMMNPSRCSLGVLHVGDDKEFSISIKNTGTNPFCIDKVITSCGCTEIVYSREPLLPKHEMIILGNFTAGERGIFQKEIMIFGNVKEHQPLHFIIYGEIRD